MMARMRLVFFILLTLSIKTCYGDFLCILNNGPLPFGGSVAVYDEQTLMPIAGSPFPTSVPFFLGQAGQTMVANASQTRLYIANHLVFPNTIDVLDTSTFTPITGSPFPSGGMDAQGTAIQGNRLYVTNITSSTVSALDATTLAIVAGPVASGGLQPSSVVANPATSRVYVINHNTPNLQVFDADLNPIATVAFSGGFVPRDGMVINSQGTRLYLTGQSGLGPTFEVAVFDTTPIGAPTEVAGSPFTITDGGLGCYGIAINSAGTLLYIANTQSDNVSILSTTPPLTPIAGSPFTTGFAPGSQTSSIAINPSETRLYVGGFVPHEVAVLDIANNYALFGPSLTTGLNVPIYFAFVNLISSASNLQGSQKKNDFGIEFERYNLLTWDASTSTTVAGYFVYRNGEKIASLSASTLQYEDHNRKKGVSTQYSVTSFDSNGNESSPVFVTVQ